MIARHHAGGKRLPSRGGSEDDAAATVEIVRCRHVNGGSLLAWWIVLDENVVAHTSLVKETAPADCRWDLLLIGNKLSDELIPNNVRSLWRMPAISKCLGA